MRVTVYGLWHLGCVSAACFAEAGYDVVGLDDDAAVVAALNDGVPPLMEPGLPELIRAGVAAGRLSFSTDASAALAKSEIVWVAFDTPVDDRDEADVDFVRRRLEAILPLIPAQTWVVVNSQVPAGFTRALERKYPQLRWACSPENLRLGKAIEVLRKQERIVVGVRDGNDRALLEKLLAPFSPRIEWMGIESAEMTKHAVNAFLATSVTFINEIARLCEALGADAKEVERALKSEARIGPKAYLSPGAAYAGGTLARDVRFLVEHGQNQHLDTPLFRGVMASNDVHKRWLRHHVLRLLGDPKGSVVAVLGLTYKPGTSTLRRSSAIELCRWLHEQGAVVQAYDPAVDQLPDDLVDVIRLTESPSQACAGADLAVVATEWPEFKDVSAGIIGKMRNKRVIDPNRFLVSQFGADPGIVYMATGKAA